MKFYCGIDLSARDCHVCVIDEREAGCFTASPLGCLVQFSHSGNSAWDWQAETSRLCPPTGCYCPVSRFPGTSRILAAERPNVYS
jgi:hypothetical protein